VTVYVADTGNNAIRMIGPDGTVSTVAGDPGRTGAVDGAAGGPAVAFTRPGGVTASADGRTLYVADTGNHLVRVIRGGAVSTLAGSAGVPGSQDGAGAAARLNAPAAIALDGSGNLYVANAGSSTVCQITPAGAVTTILGNGTLSGTLTGPLPALIAPPHGIAVDQPTSDIYITIDDAVMQVDFHP
jgi:DNA-binding beta-propeller fold protein YncE